MPTLVPAYDPWLVLVSVLIAGLASYVALDLARRVRDPDPKVAAAWGLGGSVALGTGIWAMHFVGMLAFSLPIALGYGYALTALSWTAAVAVSGLALALASRGRLTGARLAGGAMTLGAGICAMHYTGMAALDMQPGIVWDWGWVALSGLVAVAASASALVIFSWLRHAAERRHGAQAAAAAIMGLAIAGMHYTGMAAAGFPQGSVCLSAGALGGSGLAAAVVGASAALLLATLLTSMLDGRLRSHSARLALSLQAANAELLAANAELKTLAFRDPLTGLPNRLLFEDRLRLAVARVDRLGGAHRLAVLFVDLDGFKPINDSLGHAQGDRVLCEAARRLRLATRETDSVARIGGDEFVLALETYGDADEGARMAQRLVAELGAPQDLAGRRFSISASVGIALYPDDGAADKLLAHADAAMFAAKRGGGGSCMRFEPDMADDASEQLGLQHDLRGAIERQQLSLHYQPKVDARTGELRGVEALLRWQHPTLGAVSPGVFIPLAERFGLIGALGDWVIDEACRQMGEWAAAGLRQRLAINVSVHQLRHDGLVGHIEDALRRHRLDPADLLCEITESHSMDDLPHGGRVFDELLRIGVFLSIDDFGTGHSSLSRLRQLPARQLKIDRSFVAGLELGDDAAALVRAMVGMAHALGLCVVAEGVETEAQRRRLAQLGCDELQGYLLARPMPAAALPGWIAGRSGQRFADEVEPVLAEVKL